MNEYTKITAPMLSVFHYFCINANFLSCLFLVVSTSSLILVAYYLLKVLGMLGQCLLN